MKSALLLSLAFGGLLTGVSLNAVDLPPIERAITLAEALNRISPQRVQNDPKMQEALQQAMTALRGTPQFVQLAQRFKVPGQERYLIMYALRNPTDEIGLTALQLALNGRDQALFKETLNGSEAYKMVDVLGNVNHKAAVLLLRGVALDNQRDATLRQRAVLSLSGTQDGSRELITLAKAGTLPGDLFATAGGALRTSRWTNLREEAAKVFPESAAIPTSAKLPGIPELLTHKGDPAHGAKVFRSETVGCIKCHRINGEGVDFGPALSEIGTKLGKDAIYQAILDPSAGIAFGYEAWDIELKNGDEMYGLIISETESELTLKDVRAIPTRVAKNQILKRTQSKTSIMPAGLQEVMSTQDLVDVVEYLSTLKKP